MRLRAVFILLSLIILVGFLAYRIELAFQEQRRAYTTLIRLARSLHRGSMMCWAMPSLRMRQQNCFKRMKDATNCLQNGAVAVTEKLLALGREVLYRDFRQ